MKQNKFFNHIRKNWISKVLALICALFLYVFLQFNTLETRVITIPIDILYPTQYEAVSIVPTSVDISITGSEKIIYLIPAESIIAKADFSNVENEGVTQVPVELTFDAPPDEILDLSTIGLKSNPSDIRIYFKESL